MEFPTLVQHILRQARDAHHRRALWLSGERHWCHERARIVIEATGLPPTDILWCGNEAPSTVRQVAPDRARHHLGREYRLLMVDAFAGLDPDALGALSGTLSGGGLWCLLSPPPEIWPDHSDPQRARIAVAGWPESTVSGRYLARFARLLASDPHLLHVAQHQPLPSPPRTSPSPPPPPTADDPCCATPDQARAVAAVVKSALGARRRPTVLTADRGRGKSAALGIAAARVLLAGRRRILLTAPHPEAARTVIQHAATLLPGAVTRTTRLAWREAEMTYLPPDTLLNEHPPADLLLVDEAAAIPTPLLLRLLQGWPRIAFATTVHGYEGSGRGFALRFHHLLDRYSRGWRAIRLTHPIRWADGDPVEALVFRLLLLDAEAGPSPTPPPITPLHPEDRDRLACDEPRLGRLFGLLVNAHYRTRPSDLRHLLDGPNLSLFAPGAEGPACCALVAVEGGFPEDFAEAIWRGERRPHGHLLPESLAVHLGLAEAPRLRGARVVRIAVHPRLQRRGIGSRLLSAVGEWADREGLDYWGASFGATPELLRFWTRNGLLPVRVSLSRSAMSGEHSVLVLAPLTPAGESLARAARERFAEQLPHALGDHLRHLDPALVDALLPGLPPLAGTERPEEVTAYAHHRRLLEAAVAPLTLAAWRILTEPDLRTRLEFQQRHALILRLLQKRDWSHCAHGLGLPGRRQVDALLREAFQRADLP